ncbi:MAG: FHA domain-containing protein [Gammaproteobacteria bacterium]|nr:FHA domain-containing protein [Gammaproteobacteria bacterium]
MAKQTFIIGRAGELKLYDDTVSRRHAALEIEDGAMFLRDLDSRNGTYEIRDKVLVPFAGGAIERDQVFAFGECVRSVTQLLDMVAEHGGDLGGLDAPPVADPAAFDVTVVGLEVAPRPRLSAGDIIALLDHVDAAVSAGETLEDACREVGINVQRYERWCREHGASPGERGRNDDDVRRENERLRKLVADLSLEREALKEALAKAAAKDARAAAAPPISLVRDGQS